MSVVLEENVPYENPEYPEYSVIHTRSQPRNKYGELCVRVMVYIKPYPVIQLWPLYYFIDEDDEFTDEVVCGWVNNWAGAALKYPKVRRNCIMCNCKTKQGSLLCYSCIPEWHAAIYKR